MPSIVFASSTNTSALGSGARYPEVENYSALTAIDPNTVPDEIRVVRKTTGIIGFRNLSGLYQSQETFIGSGVYQWVYLGYDRDDLSIKTRYERNANTNAYTDSDKAKVDLIDPIGANNGDILVFDNVTSTFIPEPQSALVTNFEFVQAVPASNWNIIHNLGYNPNVATVDSSKKHVFGDIQYIVDGVELRVSFSGAFSGRAYLS